MLWKYWCVYTACSFWHDFGPAASMVVFWTERCSVRPAGAFPRHRAATWAARLTTQTTTSQVSDSAGNSPAAIPSGGQRSTQRQGLFTASSASHSYKKCVNSLMCETNHVWLDRLQTCGVHHAKNFSTLHFKVWAHLNARTCDNIHVCIPVATGCHH